MAHKSQRKIFLLTTGSALCIDTRSVACDNAYIEASVSIRYGDGSEVSSLVKRIPDDRKLNKVVIPDKIIRIYYVLFKPDKRNICRELDVYVSPCGFVKQELTLNIVGNIIVFKFRPVYRVNNGTLFINRNKKIINCLRVIGDIGKPPELVIVNAVISAKNKREGR